MIDARAGLATPRRQLLDRLADAIVSLQPGQPLRVAIDGIDAAGKTTLADELAGRVEALGRPVIRASVDEFHRPRAERHRQGADSPRGYYEDSFDHDSLRKQLLLPLGPNGNRMYRRAAFDYRADMSSPGSVEHAPDAAVLLFDGIFLLRPELDDLWDFRIFVEVSFETALRRAMERDVELFGSVEEVERRYQSRYFPAQRWYLETVQPRERAEIVVKNDDPDHPEIVAPRM